MQKIFISILIFSLPGCSFFFPYDDEATVVSSRMKDLNAVGMATVTLSAGGIISEGYYGYSDLENSIKTTQTTLFPIASVSKTIVAMALMAAVDDELLDLDNDINSYLPEGQGIRHPDYPDTVITPGMLATHSAGIGTLVLEIYGEEGWNFDWNNSDESYPELGTYVEEFLTPGGQYYSGNSWIEKPGSSSVYSNEGIALLAYVIQCAAGQDNPDITFQEYCQQRFLDPMDLEGYWFLGEVPDLTRVAKAYSVNSNNPYPFFAPPAWPSGSFITSIDEYAKIVITLLNDGNYEGQQILSSEAVALMFEEQREGYSLIWYTLGAPINGRSFLGHEGGLEGIHTCVCLDTDSKTGFVVFSNTDFVYTWSYQEILMTLDNISRG